MKTLEIVLITVLCSLCGAQREVIQSEGFKMAKLGQTVVIKCLLKGFWKTRVWYKLGSGRLQQVTSTNSWQHNTPLDNNFLVQSSDEETTLTIKNLTVEDLGTYFCGALDYNDIHFGSGTVLVTEGQSETVQSVLQTPVYIRAQPGDSVTLSCSFTSSHCPQEHTSFMWVRSGSASSEIVSWSYGSENIFCENSGEASCVHNLTLRDVSSAEDGTYLCVVTACGDTLIRNATRIHVTVSEGLLDISLPVVALSVLNVVFGVAVVVLVWVVCHCHRRRAKEAGSSSDAAEITVGDEVTYAGVSVVPRSAPRRSTTAAPRQDTVVYSEVRNKHI